MNAYEYAEQELSQINARKQADAEALAAIRRQMNEEMDEAIRAFLRQHPAGEELIEHMEIASDGADRKATIQAPGLGKIAVYATIEPTPRVRKIGAGNFSEAGFAAIAALDVLTAALVAARADWLSAEEWRRKREAEIAAMEAARLREQAAADEKQAADEAKIDAWAPAYRGYLSALRETYRRNCAIFGEIQHHLNAGVFTAHQIEYGFGIGEDIGTRTAWITQEMITMDAAGTVINAWEISAPGNAEGSMTRFTYPHPGKIGAMNIYTVQNAPRHLLRRATIFDGITRHDLIAAPSSTPLNTEVEAMLTGRKQIEPPPAMPAAPKLADEWRLSNAAAAIEQEVIPDAGEREDMNHLFASRLPF